MALIFGSQEYQDEILSKMIPGEYVDKSNKRIPKAAGLWNTCVREVGVLECSTDVAQAPPGLIQDVAHASCTVVVNVTLTPYIGRYYPVSDNDGTEVADDQRILSNDKFTFSGAFDAGSYNNPDFFFFLSSTAETVALGRALKKALAINCHTQEELNQDLKELKKKAADISDIVSLSDMSSSQFKAIVGHIKTLNVDEEKLFMKILGRPSLDGANKLEANKLLGKLNEWLTSGSAPKSYTKS